MKKLIYAVTILMAVLVMVGTSYSANYEKVIKETNAAEVEEMWNTIQETPAAGYIEYLVSEDEIIELADSGKFNKEQAAVLKKHSNLIYKALQCSATSMVMKIKDKKFLTDNNFIYITGVLNDPKAMVAKNGPQYQMEKQFWEANTLYRFAVEFKKRKILESQLKGIVKVK
jgi:hypothetical protein